MSCIQQPRTVPRDHDAVVPRITNSRSNPFKVKDPEINFNLDPDKLTRDSLSEMKCHVLSFNI